MSNSDLSVVRHPPIRSQIATILRNAIISREFAPGQVLIERDLCERTGASRLSVREALRQLEAEGLTESRNGRGTVVRKLTPEETSNLYEVRAELEGLAAELFTLKAASQDRADLREALTVLQNATNTEHEDRTSRILEAKAEFYNVLFAGTRNLVLEQLIQGLQVRLAQLRSRTLSVPGRAETSLAEFEELVSAIDSGDASAARETAIRHVRHAAKIMESLNQQDAD